MAHWVKTPEEMRALTPSDLEVMEMAFLLLERRQSETLDNLIGTMIGASWDAETLMGGAGPPKGKGKKEFTWSFRKKTPRVHLPLALALTQNPKFMQNLKQMASTAVNTAREDPSVVDAPSWVRKSEIVDLSYVSKAEFLKVAGMLAS